MGEPGAFSSGGWHDPKPGQSFESPATPLTNYCCCCSETMDALWRDFQLRVSGRGMSGWFNQPNPKKLKRGNNPKRCTDHATKKNQKFQLCRKVATV